MLHLLGLPGPTHGFGGLSPGNHASTAHAGQVSDPRAAARQCLAQARLLLDLGLASVVLPPLPRPQAAFLDACAGHDDPWLTRVASSCAFTWAANAGTVARGDDGTVRLLVANLAALLHRSLEPAGRLPQLTALLPGLDVLPPLPSHADLGDEGAANASTVVGPRGSALVLVHGREAGEVRQGHPARQTRQACQAIARRLGVADPLLVRQHPAAIDAGAFHNDVVMVGEGDRLLLHPLAWADQAAALTELARRCGPLRVHEVPDLPLGEAVRSYLFNSLLLPTPGHGWVLVAPVDSAEGPARLAIGRLLAEGFIDAVRFLDLRQSMMGGGGPACLRLRLPTGPEVARPGSLTTHDRLAALEAWVSAHYRDRLTWDDLADPALAQEAARAQAAWPFF